MLESLSTCIMSVPAMFLAFEDWSPRFESTFYTIKMESYELVGSPPEANSISSSSTRLEGKYSFPAYYYRIEILCGKSKHSVLRRYSQFASLYRKIAQDHRNGANDPSLPPGTCLCQPQDESFAQNRLEQLREFFGDILQLQGVSSHPAIVGFLELEAFASG